MGNKAIMILVFGGEKKKKKFWSNIFFLNLNWIRTNVHNAYNADMECNFYNNYCQKKVKITNPFLACYVKKKLGCIKFHSFCCC